MGCSPTYYESTSILQKLCVKNQNGISQGLDEVLSKLPFVRFRQLNLIFKASDFQFSAKQFHRQCDERPNILFVGVVQFAKSDISKPVSTLQDSPQRIIGAYSPSAFKKCQNLDFIYAQDQSCSSFLFSLYSKSTVRIYKLQQSNKMYALKSSPKLGPCFGRYKDLSVSDRAHETSSISELGGSYQAGNGKKSANNFSLLSGWDFFTFSEYLVYEVIKN